MSFGDNPTPLAHPTFCAPGLPAPAVHAAEFTPEMNRAPDGLLRDLERDMDVAEESLKMRHHLHWWTWQMDFFNKWVDGELKRTA